MKILANFDRAITEVLADKVKARLSFKVLEHFVGLSFGECWLIPRFAQRVT